MTHSPKRASAPLVAATAHVLLLPGWQNSGPGHWQAIWEQRHGDTRVQQSDWFWPRRGDWMAKLEDEVLASPLPVLLAAHSLGCHLAAAWAAHSRNSHRALGALLVAPPDLLQPNLPPQLSGWVPPVLQRLPFPARLVCSSDDPYCSIDAAHSLANAWGAELTPAGDRGHLNAKSGLGDWPQAREWLLNLPMQMQRQTGTQTQTEMPAQIQAQIEAQTHSGIRGTARKIA